MCVEYVQRAEGVGTEGTDAEWQRDLTEEGIEPHPGPRVLSKNVRGISTVTKFTKFIQAARREADARPYAALLVQETNITGQRNASELANKAAYKKMIMISAHLPSTSARGTKGGAAILIPFEAVQQLKGGHRPP